MDYQSAYVGTYTDGESDGIYQLEITFVDGRLCAERKRTIEGGDNPSFLSLHPFQPVLYAVHEVDDGRVTAFRQTQAGALKQICSVPSGASGPCHCSVSPSGEHLLVAHYTGAVVSILPIQDDGTLEPPSDIVRHKGSSIDTERQTQAHPHSVTLGPRGTYAYAPDLGIDEIRIYELVNQQLLSVETTEVEPGAGPRHMTFHPDGEYGFLINELDSTIIVYERDEETGGLRRIQTVPTLPAEFEGKNLAADIHVHPTGQWLYGSNRGHDSIVLFSIDQQTGALTCEDHFSTHGSWPRNFAIDTTGRVLFAENQRSNTIVPFHINLETGNLTRTAPTLTVPSPVSMCLLPRSA